MYPGGQYLAPGAPPPSPPRRVAPPIPVGRLLYVQAFGPLRARIAPWVLAWIVAIGGLGIGLAIAAVIGIVAVVADGEHYFSDAELARRLVDFATSPLGLFSVNLQWALMIPAVLLACRVFGKGATGYLWSVAGRWRWGVAGRAALAIVPTFLAVMTIGGLAIPASSDDLVPDGPTHGVDWALLAVVLLTTPLQCAGEEVTFRGLVSQQLGSWFSRPRVAVAVSVSVSAVCFTALHGYAFWGTAVIFVCALVLSALTIRTGGLEASIVLHTCNNLVTLVPVALLGLPVELDAGDGLAVSDQIAVFGVQGAALVASYIVVHVVLRATPRRTEPASAVGAPHRYPVAPPYVPSVPSPALPPVGPAPGPVPSVAPPASPSRPVPGHPAPPVPPVERWSPNDRALFGPPDRGIWGPPRDHGSGDGSRDGV